MDARSSDWVVSKVSITEDPGSIYHSDQPNDPTDVMYFTLQVSETFDVPPETVQDAVR